MPQEASPPCTTPQKAGSQRHWPKSQQLQRPASQSTRTPYLSSKRPQNYVRRFAWIRRVLRSYDDRYAAEIPAAWLVERRLVLGFAARTRAMFLEILSAGEDAGVTVVLKALQKALVFEKEAEARLDRWTAGAGEATIDWDDVPRVDDEPPHIFEILAKQVNHARDGTRVRKTAA